MTWIQTIPLAESTGKLREAEVKRLVCPEDFRQLGMGVLFGRDNSLQFVDLIPARSIVMPRIDNDQVAHLPDGLSRRAFLRAGHAKSGRGRATRPSWNTATRSAVNGSPVPGRLRQPPSGSIMAACFPKHPPRPRRSASPTKSRS